MSFFVKTILDICYSQIYLTLTDSRAKLIYKLNSWFVFCPKVVVTNEGTGTTSEPEREVIGKVTSLTPGRVIVPGAHRVCAIAAGLHHTVLCTEFGKYLTHSTGRCFYAKRCDEAAVVHGVPIGSVCGPRQLYVHGRHLPYSNTTF